MDEIKEIAEPKSPQIISISAGKGGVGKTLIAVNLARTLSWSGKRVLLVDTDLYNRGSTTLVANPPITDKTTVAGLMDIANSRITRLRKVVADSELPMVTDDQGNPTSIFLIPSSATDSIVDWAHHSYDIPKFKSFMGRVVHEFANKYDIDVVIFDCRPGPEPLFLAVAGISTEIILVTEADIVTLNGNINLYRYLSDIYTEHSDVLRNVRFVINRIPKGQDIVHIEQRYMKRLFDLFKTRPVLASIPFDDSIFQSFGQHRFVVDRLPESIFSRQVSKIAINLFADSHPELVSDRCYQMSQAVGDSWFVLGKRAIVEAFGSLMKTRIVR